MSTAIRSILPRVSMSRIPVAAFVNATAVHPSAYSSMPARSNVSNPNPVNVPNTKLDIPKEYLREYKPEGLSQHAWDAIRAVESHKLLKQDRAPIHALNEEDKADARI
ncbi:hypothetical protein BGZ73_000924 [Actinomortierella ambigua]|nr:hypothetical protein BGZ73_000924 [Actinomortierella ambigua]